MARSIERGWTDDPVADLKQRARRDPRVTRTVRGWWRDHELDRVPISTCRRIASTVIDEAPQLGLAVLQQMSEQLRVADLPMIGRVAPGKPRATARLLAAMLARSEGRAELAHALGNWREAPTRAIACTALASLAPQGETAFAGLTALVLGLCATVVWSHAPVDQVAVGALLGKLATAAPTRVDAFVRRYARLMSRACVRLAIAALPARDELIALHRRATSI